jgi:LysM repeat protein
MELMNKTTNFLAGIKSGALALWSKFGILPSVAAGQAALESAWGSSGLATKYNNLFGIKGSYQGNAAMMNTWEVYGGQRYDIKDNFRAYPDQATSILDYGVFLTVNPRYTKAIKLSDYREQIIAIHNAGYATDPDYASKVISIIEKYGLVEWDKEVLNVKPVAQPTVLAKPTNGTYTVVSGDTLSEIAARFGKTISFLKKLNNIPDIDKIYVGQVIKLQGTVSQPTSAPKYHTVVSGDVVSRLAVKYGSSQSQIKAWNNLADINRIYIGQKLRVK